MSPAIGPVVAKAIAVRLIQRSMQVPSGNPKLALNQRLPLGADCPDQPAVQNLSAGVPVDNHIADTWLRDLSVAIFPENAFHLFGKNQELSAEENPAMAIRL